MSRIWSRMQNFEFIDFSFKRNHLKATLNYKLSWDYGTVSLTRLARFNPWPGVRFGNFVGWNIFNKLFLFYLFFSSHNEFNFKILWNIDGLNCWIWLDFSFSPYQPKIQQYTRDILLFDFYIFHRDQRSICKIQLNLRYEKS